MTHFIDVPTMSDLVSDISVVNFLGELAKSFGMISSDGLNLTSLLGLRATRR